MDKVNINLTREEALVLFDFLSRFNKIQNNPIFEDQSEKKVFWILENLLEKELAEIFSSNYD